MEVIVGLASSTRSLPPTDSHGDDQGASWTHGLDEARAPQMYDRPSAFLGDGFSSPDEEKEQGKASASGVSSSSSKWPCQPSEPTARAESLLQDQVTGCNYNPAEALALPFSAAIEIPASSTITRQLQQAAGSNARQETIMRNWQLVAQVRQGLGLGQLTWRPSHFVESV
jgi:hypothetical protein